MRIWLIVVLASSLMAADLGRPPIVEAAKNGDREALRTLIQKKADVNAAEGDGSTALQWASYKDDLESADLLIRAGANVNASNDLGVTALWTASQNGNTALVKRLLDAGANPNLALLAGETPVMVASRSGYPKVVELLAAKGAHVNERGTRGQTALMWAVSQQHPEVVKVLLSHHADLSLRSEVWSDVMAVPPHGYLGYNKAVPHGGETALMFAARVGDLASAKLLVAAGANVNDADAWGVSATTLAAHSDFGELVSFLLDKGADPNAYPNGFNALHEAIMRRDDAMVTALLDHHADPNAPLKTWTPTRRSSDDWNFHPALVGASPLWMAARFTEPNIMRLLIQHGADPKFVHHADWVAEQGFGQAHRTDTSTVVMAATGVGGGNLSPWVALPRSERETQTLEAVKLVADFGIDLNVASTDGRTALDGAKNLGYQSVISFLTDKGAKPGTGSTTGRGPGRREK
jgi:ankyrin repeat protein